MKTPESLQEAYDAGMVPCDRIAPVLRRAMEQRFGSTNASAAESMARQLHKYEHEQAYAEFNSVDILFAQLWAWDVWYGELADVYEAVNLSRARSIVKYCKGPACANVVDTSGRRKGKLYCSDSCKRKAWWKRRRSNEARGLPPRFGKKYDRCPRGHDRSPENVYYRPGGSYTCRVCRREDMAKRLEDPRERERVRLREAKRREERRDELNARRRELRRLDPEKYRARDRKRYHGKKRARANA